MSLHEDMTRIVKKHLPLALFGRHSSEQAEVSCHCGDRIVGDKTPEDLYADHLVQALEDSGLVQGTPGLRVGQRVMIESPGSRFHGWEGYLVDELPLSEMPCLVQLDRYDKNLPFFKHEVERL